MKFIHFLFIFTFLLCDELRAQNKQLYYTHYNTENGLINDEILYTAVDQDGYIWLATLMGLQSIETYSIRDFYNDPSDTTSLSNNFISTIFEDDSGDIWVGTRNGLSMFDKEQDSFINYDNRQGNHAQLTSLEFSRAKKTIAQDVDGYIWINSAKGLNKIDKKSRVIEQFSGDFSGQIVYDKNEHVLWIVDTNLKKFNIKTNNVDEYSISDFLGYSIIGTNSILHNSEGDIWVGTNIGLLIFSKKNNQFIDVEEYFENIGMQVRSEDKWYNKSVKALYKDLDGNIWLAIDKTIYIVNSNDGKVLSLRHEIDNKNSILDGKIHGIYGNQSGTIVLSYDRGGISKITLNTSDFRHIRYDKNTERSLNSRSVRSIYVDKNKNLWAGTYNQGLNYLPGGKPNNVHYYTHDPQNKNTIPSNYITAIFIDSKERLWIGTFEYGYCYADDIYSTSELKFHRSDFKTKVEIHEFTEDQFNNVWISTDSGFYIYDYQTLSLRHYGDLDHEIKDVQGLNIQSVVYEAPNVFWLATWNKGVHKLVLSAANPVNGIRTRDKLINCNEKNNVLNTENQGYITILRDKAKNFWLGSSNPGLVKMVEGDDTYSYTSYNTASGAPSNTVYGIREDEKGNIWISTSNGLGVFDPVNETFNNYYDYDGTLGNSYSWDAHFKTTDGEILFGGEMGITSFYPNEISKKVNTIEPIITKLIVNHEEVNPRKKINDRFILDKTIRYSKELTLTHNASVFSFEFSVPNKGNVDAVNYSYMLEGYDPEWIVVNSERRTATYTNLNHGEYFFKVRATMQIGTWDEPTVLKLIILPPWWKSWWAYLAYFLMFFVLLYLFQQQLVNRAKLRHELEMEQYKHERDAELNRQKFRFFTNLAHEYRTPLTLILGPLEKMIRNNEGSLRVHQKHLTIYKQAQKLLKLTNQLMNFRKYETDNLQLKSAKGNFVSFMEEVVVAFRSLARNRDIHFHFHTSVREILMWYDRDKFEIILANILSNAFKFTSSKGTVSVDLSICSINDVVKTKGNLDEYTSSFYGEVPDKAERFLQIQIQDTGCGISTDSISQIFKRYYQANNLSSQSGSSGVGLEIVKNYVELHQGTILVNSEVNQGTCFFIWVPMGSDHLKEHQIIKDFRPSEDLDHYQLSQTREGDIEIVHMEIEADETPPKNAETLLIADDNPDILNYLQSIFNSRYNIIVVQDGMEALKKAQELIPDVIITDIMMPSKDGLELCRDIKEDLRTCHIPVILLTARTTNLFQTEGLETGADDYITKPFNENVLMIKVKNLIESRKVLRRKYSSELSLKSKDITIAKADENLLDRIIDFIDNNMGNSQFKIEEISQEIGMSHSVLYRKINAITGLSLIEFIRTVRLKRAAELLVNYNVTVSKASFDVGFTDPKYFSKSFHKFFGLTPSDYISKYRKSD